MVSTEGDVKTVRKHHCMSAPQGHHSGAFDLLFVLGQRDMDSEGLVPTKIVSMHMEDEYQKFGTMGEGWRTVLKIDLEMAPGNTEQSFKDWFLTQ